MTVMESTNRSRAALTRAAETCGSWAALAKALGVSPMVVNNWRSRGIPPNRCIPIEQATAGVVTRHDLRPDLYPEAATV